jgi:hypothetical protein
MNSGTATLDEASVLAAARDLRSQANAAEAGVLAKALEWAHLHLVDDLDEAATWWSGSKLMGQDTGIPIAGDGAPLVSEFAVCEFATALGLSADAGRNLVGQTLELAHRLPKIWARVQAGSLAPWRARRIAEATLHLSLEAAGFVDAQLVSFAHRTGPAQVQRLIDTAVARFMPEYAAEQRQRAADQRYFTIAHDQVSFAGTSRVHGELDLADALDLEDAITTAAAQLAALGSEESLDARRAAAVGMLARGDLALDLQTAEAAKALEGPEGSESPEEPVRTETGRATRRTPERRRDIVLYVHLSEDALRSGDRDAVARVENAGGQLVTAGQVADWCGRDETTRVVVKPVIDLNQHHATDAYVVPARIAEQVELRDGTCVFPWCHRPARGCDKDHVIPYHPDGPPGQTSTENLAPLCRLHHRVKTHGGWTYTVLEPGSYLWCSPHGYTWVRDAGGTTDLTPTPVDPPDRRTS